MSRWVGLPGISPSSAEIELLDEQTSVFVPQFGGGLMQRSSNGNRRWKMRLRYENLTRAQQNEMQAFIGSLEGRLRTFFVDVGKFTPTDVHSHFLNQHTIARGRDYSECNTGGWNVSTYCNAVAENGRVRLIRTGGAGAMACYPVSYGASGYHATYNNSGQSQDTAGSVYGFRYDVAVAPTNVGSVLIGVVMGNSGSGQEYGQTAFGGTVNTNPNTRIQAAWVCQPASIFYYIYWTMYGPPGDSVFIDNVYAGRVALVDNGQNMLPWSECASDWAFSLAGREVSSVPWLNNAQIPSSGLGLGLRAHDGNGSHCAFSPNITKPGGTRHTDAIFSMYMRNGSAVDSYYNRVRTLLQTSGEAALQFYEHNAGSAPTRTSFTLTGSHALVVSPNYAVDYSAGAQAWSRISNWVRANSETYVQAALHLVNTTGTTDASWLQTGTGGALQFKHIQLNMGVLSASSNFLVPLNFRTVPGRPTVTSASAISTGTLQTGKQLWLKGLPNSLTTAKAGAWLSVGGELKRLTADLLADGFGCGAAMFEPALLRSPVHDEMVWVGPGAFGRFMLDTPPRWSFRPGWYADLELEMSEVWE